MDGTVIKHIVEGGLAIGILILLALLVLKIGPEQMDKNRASNERITTEQHKIMRAGIAVDRKMLAVVTAIFKWMKEREPKPPKPEQP